MLFIEMGGPRREARGGGMRGPLSKCVMTVLPSGANSVWGEGVIHAKWVLETMNMDYVDKAHGVNRGSSVGEVGKSGILRGRRTRVEETKKWNVLTVRGAKYVTTRPRKDYWFNRAPEVTGDFWKRTFYALRKDGSQNSEIFCQVMGKCRED